jgi:hypothetical protein
MQLVTFHTVFPPKLCNLCCWPMRVIWLHSYMTTQLYDYTVIWLHSYMTTQLYDYTVIWLHSYFLHFILATMLLIWLTLENSAICNVYYTYMPVLNIILVTRECELCTCIFCDSVFVREKKTMIDVKAAVISSRIHQE